VGVVDSNNQVFNSDECGDNDTLKFIGPYSCQKCKKRYEFLTDCNTGKTQGWIIVFNEDTEKLEIQKRDSSIFKSDNEAYEFVRKTASFGNIPASLAME
jgi:hypothetical protein